ncbi:hypothetical protein CGRA01v4_06116 [Colletotrichum graminicola]|nr:hypothetical protein CGRA01v4_06116 [Colletotrichum graminicola]
MEISLLGNKAIRGMTQQHLVPITVLLVPRTFSRSTISSPTPLVFSFLSSFRPPPVSLQTSHQQRPGSSSIHLHSIRRRPHRYPRNSTRKIPRNRPRSPYNWPLSSKVQASRQAALSAWCWRKGRGFKNINASVCPINQSPAYFSGFILAAPFLPFKSSLWRRSQNRKEKEHPPPPQRKH